MRRFLVVLTMFVLVAAVWAAPQVLAQGGEGEDQDGDTNAPLVGAAVYAEFCQACHGPQGEALGEGAAFTAITYQPETAREVLTTGTDPEDGAAMPPYAQTSGGLLTEQQIDSVIAYMETWESGEIPALPEPHIRAGVDQVPDYLGDPQAGAVVYAKFCYGCHGDEGQGRVPPNFPPFGVDQNTSHVIRTGTGSPYMPGFSVEAGGPLIEEQLADLDAYLASWAIEPPEESPSPAGYSTLVIIMGIAAILFVGGAFLPRGGKSG